MPSRDAAYLNISVWTIIKILLVLILAVFLYLVRDILASLIFAIILASAFEPAIGWLKERRIPRILGVILVYLGMAAALFFILYLFIPLLLDEIKNLIATYPAFREEIFFPIERIETSTFVSLLKEGAEAFLSAPAEFWTKLGGGALGLLSAAFGGIFSFIIIVVFSFYLMAQEKGIESFLKIVTPLQYESYIIDLWERSRKKLGSWLRTQVLLAAIVGVFIFFGLTLLGVRNALLFAVLAAVFEIIPVAGPILAAVPAVITTFLASPLTGVLTVALYIVTQQIESHVIVPVLMRKTIGLSPLVVVLALLIGAKIGGFFGLLLAVPLTAILVELVEDWDKKKRALMGDNENK